MRLLRSVSLVTSFAFAWLVGVLPAAAQAPDANAASGDKAGWALGYLLVILGIALGLAGICRPGNREAEIKVTDDEE